MTTVGENKNKACVCGAVHRVQNSYERCAAREARKRDAKYRVEEQAFNTKSECEEYTRGLVNKLGVGEIRRGDAHFGFFDALLHNHPFGEEKRGPGIDRFIVGWNLLSKTANNVSIVRVNGTTRELSWKTCCQSLGNNPTYDKDRIHRAALTSAMRSSIGNFTEAFKQSQVKDPRGVLCGLTCEKCRSNVEFRHDYHVDHIEPFEHLRQEFLKTTSLEVPKLFWKNIETHTPEFRRDDYAFETAWKTFHNERCRLQILCRGCNQRKGARW